MNFRVDSIDHVEVFVSDIESAARWYQEVMGLEEIHRWEPGPVMIGTGGTLLALFPARSPAEPATNTESTRIPGWRRVAWKTDHKGFSEAQRHLSELEIPFAGPIDHDISWSIYFADPDGNPLEITTYER